MSSLWGRLLSLFGRLGNSEPRQEVMKACACEPTPTYRLEYPKEKTIKRVYIAEGCMICDACSTTCPDVFRLPAEKDSEGNWQSALVKAEARSFFESKMAEIHEAADGCCVSVIKIEYTDETEYNTWDDRRRGAGMTKPIPS
ncbi:MAG TPA: ferredoxin [Holophagaceae bacterium]|nr:ferredoxin [Holophagaceae bacterium]